MGFLSGSAYLWLVAFHVIFVIFWMAGLFMMPRYFAYHMETSPQSKEEALWIKREKSLLRIILNPAMIIAWILGGTLALDAGFSDQGWFHVKATLVVFLTLFHMLLAKTRRQLAQGERKRSSRFFRLINEIPAFFIIAIVILVVVKPF